MDVHQSYREHTFLTKVLDELAFKKTFAFWQHEESFSKLLASDFIEFALEKEAAAFCEEEYYQLPLYYDADRIRGWVVLSTPYFRLSTYHFDQRLVNKHREMKKGNKFSLQVASQDQLLYFPKGGKTVIDVYQVEENSNMSDVAEKIRLKESINVIDGQFIQIKAGVEALHFKCVGEDVHYHEISNMQSGVRVIGEYNLKSLDLVGVSAANLSSSRAEMFSEMVANFNYKPSIPVLEKLCAHKDHFVRWSAATSLYSLDNSAGEVMIKTLANDPHQDVRQTAKQCLAMFASA